MLTPEYLDVCADDLINLYRELDESIVRILAERIAKTNFVSESSKWQAEMLQQAGMTYDEVIAEISKYTGKSKDELERLFNDAGVESIEADNEIYKKAGLVPTGLKQSAAMVQTLKAGLAKTNGSLLNLTLTTAVAVQTAYINACNLAYMQISSGAMSLPDAVRHAVKSAARQGTRVIYPSGHSDQLDVAIRRAALTGVNQTCAQIQLANAADMGCNLVETTAHIGARPSHAEWQGRVFMINGSSREYPNLAENTGYGTGDGLCGWNCRHNFFPFFEGIDLRTYRTDDLEKLKNDGYYEAEQKQRAMERNVRATRRELAGYDSAMSAAKTDVERAAIKQEFDKASVKLKKQERQLKDYRKSNGLVYDSSRVQTHYGNNTTHGFGRSASQKAVWANKKQLKKSTTSGKIVSGALNPNSAAAQKHADRYYESVRHMKTDINRISANTGFSESDIAEIKSFIFMQKHDLGNNEPEYFYPSYIMAQSWQRLIDGKNIQPHDLTLLNHEKMERELMQQGYSQEEAHKITEIKYNYHKEANAYYAEINKHKKKR